MFSKIIIYTQADKNSKDQLQTVVMRTDGLRVTHVLYLDKVNTVKNDKKSVIAELRSELYEDMYDINDLVIKAKEVADGHHIAIRVAKFLYKIRKQQLESGEVFEDDLILFYGDSDDMIDEIQKQVNNIDSDIHIQEYYSMFLSKPNISIIELMKINGLKTENLIPDSQISFTYFLSTLAEVINSR